MVSNKTAQPIIIRRGTILAQYSPSDQDINTTYTLTQCDNQFEEEIALDNFQNKRKEKYKIGDSIPSIDMSNLSDYQKQNISKIFQENAYTFFTYIVNISLFMKFRIIS